MSAFDRAQNDSENTSGQNLSPRRKLQKRRSVLPSTFCLYDFVNSYTFRSAEIDCQLSNTRIMPGISHDTIMIDPDVDMDLSAPITTAQTAGGIETFPLSSRIRAFLTDLNVAEEDSSKRPEFLSEQAYCILRTWAFEPSQAVPTRDVLDVISQVASTPGCAYLVVKHFRPLLVDVFARWLLQNDTETKTQERWETELFVLAEVAEFVPELWK